MFVVHRVVNGHPQYHSIDTRNTSLGRILQKISGVYSSAILGLDRCIQSLNSSCARLVTIRPEYIGPRPKTCALAPSNTIYYFMSQCLLLIYYVRTFIYSDITGIK